MIHVSAKKQRITRRAKAEPVITNLDPAAFPDVYGMKVIGDCMSPQFESGATLCFDKRAPVAAGDTVVVFLRPEVVPAGKMQAGVKRLATAIPSWVKSFPYEEHPDSNVTALVVLEMNNPPRSFSVECRHILAIHKCLGVARRKNERGSIPPPMLPQHERVAASASEIRAEPVSRRHLIRMSAALAAIPVAAISTIGGAAVQGDDAELFRLEAEFHAAKERWNETSDRYGEAEEVYFRLRPKRLEHKKMPAAVAAAFGALTIEQTANFESLPRDHPYVVWHKRATAEEAEEFDAWDAESDRIRRELNYDELDAEQSQRFEDIDAAYDAIMDTPAVTLAGVMVKLRRGEWALDGDEERMWKLVQSVTADIERMAGGRAI